ncbi:hypothetical protein HYU21_04025 [Candidatus Woesearchaeota archaeon]|nr:hypothetical protein [Candidatus Woesearchaeota archaeon]
MSTFRELQSRIKEYFTFSLREISGLAVAVILTGFIFSFRNWGLEEFSFATGFKNFITTSLAVALIFILRFSCQKIYGLSCGYKVEFNPWWPGFLIALIVAFISKGFIPLILIGGVSVIFISRQRLGEFRYGFSYWENGVISLWAVYAQLIAGLLFALCLYAFPQSLFFHKGMIISLLGAFFCLLPLPPFDGLNIFFASRNVYLLAFVLLLTAAVLLLTQTLAGLILAVVIGALIAIVYLLIS